jgi:3-methyladenine DNA glycosylase AlkD
MAMKKSPARKPAAKSTAKSRPSAAPAALKPPAARMTLAEAMSALERAGSEQARKTYQRHGATGPLFGVGFATLKVLVKRAGVDHDLATALWDTGNFDARVLAVKVADPARATAGQLDRWAGEARSRMLVNYVAQLAGETPHAAALLAKWRAADPNGPKAAAAWPLAGQMATHDTTTPDSWFLERLAEIERTIHAAPNAQREGMNMAVVVIGCRNEALRLAATAAAKRIGKVVVDHGETACKTPDAADYIAKTWAHSTSNGFESPAAHERSREPVRCRC